MHGFLLSINSKTITEGYWKPFSSDQPHRMFSVSKSMTALAIGILIGQGRLALTDKIVSFFPEFTKEGSPPQLERLTIRDMLRMATCHSATTYKKAACGNWTKTFFTVPPTHEPGTVFSYDTSSSHVLAALVEKLARMPLLSLLQENLFEKIGAHGPKRWMTDPSGTSQGGTGLLMTLGDMSKAAHFCMGNGEGIVPEDFLRIATSKQIDTPLRELSEERHGYGYQFWCAREGFAMYGMGGQLAVCVPRLKLALCTLADTQLDPYGVQRIHNAFFEEIVPHVTAHFEENGEESLRLKAKVDSLSMKALMDKLQYHMEPDGLYEMMPNPMGWTAIQLKSDGLHLRNGDGWGRLPFELGRMTQSTFPGGKEPCVSSAGWYAPGSLRIQSHVIGDTPCGVEIQLIFLGDAVTMHAECVIDPITKGFSGIASGYRD